MAFKDNPRIRHPDKRKIIPAPTTFASPDDDDIKIRVNVCTRYTARTARTICKRIMMKESLKQICSDPRMPAMRTVMDWLADPRMAEFREMYYYARRIQAEMYIDEIFEIADDTSKDWKAVKNKDGDVVDWKPDNEAIQRSRVRIDTRKWFAGQMVPRIYGKRVDVSHDITGDLKELLEQASNKDAGLPKPVNDV